MNIAYEFLCIKKYRIGSSAFRSRKRLAVILIIIVGFFIRNYNINTANNSSNLIDLFKEFSSSCKPILLEGNFMEERKNTNKCSHYKLDNEEDSIRDYDCMKKWKPNGCSLKFYSFKEAENCLRISSKEKKYIIFIGDSRLRYLHNEIILFLGKELKEYKYFRDDFIFHEETRTNFTYSYRKYMNASFVDDLLNIQKIAKHHPTLIVVGITLHMMVKYQDEPKKGFQEYETYLTKAKKLLHDIASSSTLLWFLQAPYSTSMKIIERYLEVDNKKSKHIRLSKNVNKFFMQNIEKLPLYDELIKKVEKGNANKVKFSYIPQYNNITIKVLKDTSVKLWYSAKYIGESSTDDYTDNGHLAIYHNYNLFQIILNMVCNRHMNFPTNTCCV